MAKDVQKDAGPRVGNDVPSSSSSAGGGGTPISVPKIDFTELPQGVTLVKVRKGFGVSSVGPTGPARSRQRSQAEKPA